MPITLQQFILVPTYYTSTSYDGTEFVSNIRKELQENVHINGLLYKQNTIHGIH